MTEIFDGNSRPEATRLFQFGVAAAFETRSNLLWAACPTVGSRPSYD